MIQTNDDSIAMSDYAIRTRRSGTGVSGQLTADRSKIAGNECAGVVTNEKAQEGCPVTHPAFLRQLGEIGCGAFFRQH